MTSQSKDYPEPPKEPAILRKLHLYVFQYIGIPLILLIPILALSGVFNQQFAQLQQENDALALSIHYPNRSRYEVLSNVTINIENKTEETIPLVLLSISKSYLKEFFVIDILPLVSQITEENYEVELEEIASEESRLVTIDLEGDIYGEHTATVSLASEGIEPLSLTIKTFVFP
jgi:hypothetical protein